MVINCLKLHLKPKKEVVPDLFEHDLTRFLCNRQYLGNFKALVV
jgi:hypothetical protein